jgi:hypothetical protein
VESGPSASRCDITPDGLCSTTLTINRHLGAANKPSATATAVLVPNAKCLPLIDDKARRESQLVRSVQGR